MKKSEMKFAVLLTALLSVVAFGSTPIELVNADFDLPGVVKVTGWDGTGAAGSNTEDIPGWFSDADAADSGVETNSFATTGNWIAFIMQSDESIWQTTSHVIDSGQSFVLSLDGRNTSNAGTVTMSLYFLDGTERVTFATQDIVLTGEMVRYSLIAPSVDAASPAVGNVVGVEINHILSENGTSNGWAGIDTVTLEVNYVSPVAPAVEEEYVDINGTLEWAVANDWNVDLYLTTDEPNMDTISSYKKVTNQQITEYTFANLDFYSTYYWRVDAYEPNDASYIIHKGPVWSFTTRAQEPLVAIAMKDLTVAYGETAVFSMTASDTEQAVWYKVGEEAPLSGAKYSSSVVADADKFIVTLEIADFQLADEGSYYAVLSNSATTQTTETAPVKLLAERLMGWWEFNGNIEDSVDTVIPGVTPHDGTMVTVGSDVPYTDALNYTPGIIDQALEFTPADDENNSSAYFASLGSEEDMNFVSRGFTVATWFKTNHDGWGAIVGKGRRLTNGWVMEHNNNDVTLVFRGGSAAGVSANIADGQWHLLVGTYNPEKGMVEMYASDVDDKGQLRLKYSGVTSVAPSTTTELPLTVGIELDPDFENVYSIVAGEVDDLKVYSYAMTAEEVAGMLYYPVVNAPICMESEIGGEGIYDVNDDCQIDVIDFAAFAANWLECRVYPDCQ